MKLIKMSKPKVTIEVQKLKYLELDFADGEHIATLIDPTGYEILKGYGKTIVDAVNDLHHNLL